MTLLLTSFAASLLAIVAVRLAARRDPAGSPLLIHGSFLLLLALPLLAALPKIHFTLPAEAPAPLFASTYAMPGLGVLWLIGFAVFALRFLGDHLALARWKSQAIRCHDPRFLASLADCRRQLGLRGRVQLHMHPRIGSPSIAGLFRPVIFLPAAARSWSVDTLRMVLLHELGHLARRDLWTGLTARLACLVHWFNPFVWVLRRQLMAQCEFACDTLVIATGANPATYATALCDVAEESSPVPAAALAMADPASLRQRVELLVRGPRQHTPLLIVAALLLTVTASVAISVVRVRPFDPAASGYTPEEIHLRLTANPFPGE